MHKVAIIGAGITGLCVAEGLAGRANVTVFEKSWGPGGRMATRRFRLDDGFAFADHGAPYVHARTDAFRAFMEERERAGHAARWGERDGMPAWVGLPHMNTMLAALAERHAVRFQARVDAVERAGDGWHLALAPHEREGGTATGREGPFDAVVVAVPATQAARLMSDEGARLAAVEADPCWTWMGVFERLPPIGARRHPAEGLEWVAANGEKPGRDGPATLVAHSTNAWSREHLEDATEVVEARMAALVRTFTDLPETQATAVHRWRYSATARPLGEPFLDAGNGLYLCGDWCLGPHAEDGFLSAKALLEAI